MAKTWVKQLTRENTLLDRSLRTIAYAEGLRDIGKGRIARSPVVGKGRVTSLYYDPIDYKKQQAIIGEEFLNRGVAALADRILTELEVAYRWGKQQRRKKISRGSFQFYFEDFTHHHATARGAVTYGYWGEPWVTHRVQQLLKRKHIVRIDDTLSLLSVPRTSPGILHDLHHSSKKLLEKRNSLLHALRLSNKEREIVELLSWCTFFYELGERVASFLYDDFVRKLRKIVGENEFEKLEWYDPLSLKRYFSGKRLPITELRRRAGRYILLMKDGKLEIVSGRRAETIYRNEFQGSSKGVRSHEQLKGVVASTGHATGRVSIIITEADQKKMKKGDILISTMTTPRLMAAIQLAAAIVTDEGGMTAHAAIVARELKIPCIVGTQAATASFKDGDIVEVDAERGYVRRIK